MITNQDYRKFSIFKTTKRARAQVKLSSFVYFVSNLSRAQAYLKINEPNSNKNFRASFELELFHVLNGSSSNIQYSARLGSFTALYVMYLL